MPRRPRRTCPLISEFPMPNHPLVIFVLLLSRGILQPYDGSKFGHSCPQVNVFGGSTPPNTKGNNLTAAGLAVLADLTFGYVSARPSAYPPKAAISYSTWPSTSQLASPDPVGTTATIPANSPYIFDEDITQVETQGRTYYKFSCNKNSGDG
ncbi:hypothetical protein GMDG_05169 [Pseudogymnoascus destructans 20631-21]|uniref:Uncharacterized protein n=1 Tax=Pseudogymnoascus destructans (strain ATCC MYA-4855 / 20631-21) TaxID=658429 RepID=L8FM48_PSED2|nr:hypothetical protein GMDG_05169 [Pseudogymnoascus destructans 20631-21]